jgi:hypothetical protein
MAPPKTFEKIAITGVSHSYRASLPVGIPIRFYSAPRQFQSLTINRPLDTSAKHL